MYRLRFNLSHEHWTEWVEHYIHFSKQRSCTVRFLTWISTPEFEPPFHKSTLLSITSHVVFVLYITTSTLCCTLFPQSGRFNKSNFPTEYSRLGETSNSSNFITKTTTNKSTQWFPAIHCGRTNWMFNFTWSLLQFYKIIWKASNCLSCKHRSLFVLLVEMFPSQFN